MTIDIRQLLRVARRLKEATGYFELGMMQHALDCLENLGELGPFEAEVSLLRGVILRRQNRFDDARAELRTAAEKFPAPFDRSAWYALSLCYRQVGDMNRAIQSLARARGASPHKERPSAL
ncbi:MAG: tetratricopeptide repeat protein [Planctomycetota bacterium]